VRAVRWITAGVIEDLGPGYALGASADGSVVVGKNDYAFRWTPERGMEDLNITFANLLTDGSRLLTASAISDNGRYIVGEGINAATGLIEAFLLDTRPGGPYSVEEKPADELPVEYQLKQNYPNPFNPSTTISFSLPQRSHVTLKVFDLLGREVATLVDGEMAAGEHSVSFNARGFPSGVYFTQMKAANVVQRIKMVLNYLVKKLFGERKNYL